MARYRKIDPRIWNDAKFSALSHEAQRAFFFVLTHPAMTALGAFRITREGMAAELGLAGKGFVEPFGELLEKGLVKYDESAFLLFVPNFLKYNPPENPNVIKSWEGSIDYLPECPLLAEVLAKASACAANTDAGSKAFAKTLGRVYETLSERYSKPLPKGMPKQEQEQEHGQERTTTASTFAADAAEDPALQAPPDLPAEELWGDEYPVPADAEAPAAEKPKLAYPRCEYEKVVALYHEKCPGLQRVMANSDARRRTVGARWKDFCREDGYKTTAEVLDAFSWYFDRVAASPFLMGQLAPGFGRDRAFVADFDWLMKPANFIKVCEGKYTHVAQK